MGTSALMLLPLLVMCASALPLDAAGGDDQGVSHTLTSKGPEQRLIITLSTGSPLSLVGETEGAGAVTHYTPSH